MSKNAGKPIQCKAMVMWDKDADQKEETIFVDPPKAGEVRLKVLASGVCHTDWVEPRNFPAPCKPEGSDKEGFGVILGHEGGCIVESIGEGVTTVKPGDYVIPLYIPECRNCDNCTKYAGRTNLCSATDETQYLGKMLDGTSRFWMMKDGAKVELLHFMGCSTFSEYTVVPEIACAKISNKAPLEKVCLLGCGVTTGYGAVVNTAKCTPNCNAVVFGLGGVGLAVVMALKQIGATRIFGVDVNPEKEAIAREFGLTDFINPKTDVKEGDSVEGTCWQRLGGGFDYSFECVGNVKLMRAAVELLKDGTGKAIVIGVAPAGAEVSIKPLQLVLGKTWSGSAFGGTRGRTQLPQYVNQYLAGLPPFVDEFVSVTLPHTELNEAFHLMHQGKTLRSVITFPHEGDEEVAAHRAAHRQAKSAVVFMHGLGDKPSSWQESVEWLCGKIGPNAKPVSPAAPIAAITKNNGERTTAWFDVLAAWPRTPASKDDVAGIAASVDNVHMIIDNLVKKDKIPAERIIIAGFSQGGVMAVASTYSYRKKLGGCICLSGWVPDRANFKPNDANAETPLFWGHGAADEVVSVENQAAGSSTLKKTTLKTYDKLGHDTSEAEFDDVLAFIKSRLL